MNRHTLVTPPARAHRYGLRVYYEDTDAGGVVYHAVYLGMAERARTEALRDLGVPHAALLADHGLMFMVRRVNLDYAAPARLDDSLIVATWGTRLGRASIDLHQTVFREGEALVAAQVQLACVRHLPSRPGGLAASAIPDRWRVALASLTLGED